METHPSRKCCLPDIPGLRWDREWLQPCQALEEMHSLRNIYNWAGKKLTSLITAGAKVILYHCCICEATKARASSRFLITPLCQGRDWEHPQRKGKGRCLSWPPQAQTRAEANGIICKIKNWSSIWLKSTNSKQKCFLGPSPGLSVGYWGCREAALSCVSAEVFAWLSTLHQSCTITPGTSVSTGCTWAGDLQRFWNIPAKLCSLNAPNFSLNDHH